MEPFPLEPLPLELELFPLLEPLPLELELFPLELFPLLESELFPLELELFPLELELFPLELKLFPDECPCLLAAKDDAEKAKITQAINIFIIVTLLKSFAD